MLARLRIRNPASIVVGLTTLVVGLGAVGVAVGRGVVASKKSEGFAPLVRDKDYNPSHFDLDILTDPNTGAGEKLLENPPPSTIVYGSRVLVVLAVTGADGKPIRATAFFARYVVTSDDRARNQYGALLQSARLGAGTTKVPIVGGFRELGVEHMAFLLTGKAGAT